MPVTVFSIFAHIPSKKCKANFWRISFLFSRNETGNDVGGGEELGFLVFWVTVESTLVMIFFIVITVRITPSYQPFSDLVNIF